MKKKDSGGTSGKIIVQHNRLIEARYNLSLQEKRVVLWLISQIDRDDKGFKEYKITIREFSKILDLDTKNQYTQVRLVFERLMRRVITITNTETDKTLQVHWVSSAEYSHGDGCVAVCFDPKLAPYLLQLKSEFTKISLADVLSLKSIYSIRIFELLLQYQPIGKRTIEIKDLREYCGIETKEYADYFDLKRKVINRALKEINAKTDYEISYEEIKESRRVAAIEFFIKKKTHFEKMQHDTATVAMKEMRSRHDLAVRLCEYGFSKAAAKRLVAGKDEEVVNQAMVAADQQVAKGTVKNAKAMITKAIEECWRPNY